MSRTVRAAVFALILLMGLLPAGLALSNSPAPAGRSFSDVPAEHPDRAYIAYLADRGLINGYPDGRFGVSDPLNRAAAAKIAIQVAGLAARKTGQELSFTDLPGDHWSTPFVRAGVEAKLITGFDDKTFKPNDSLTRAQLAALAIRATRQSQDRLPSLTLNDVKPADWFYKPALLAVAAGLMEAPDGNFRPNDVATRAEAARAFAQAMVFTPLAFNTPLSVTVVPQRGVVEVQEPGGTAWTRITRATPLSEGGRVRTSGASAAAVDFPDGSSLLLDNLSEMIVHRSRGAQMIEATEVEDLDVELVKGKLLFALSPRLSATEAQALAPKLSAFLDPEADRIAAQAMEPRVRAAAGQSGENLPADATRLLLFMDPASMEPGDQEGAELTIVLANEAGEPVTASKGPVTLELLTDVGRISNPNPVIPEDHQAVVVTVYPPDTEPEDQKTRVTAVAGEITSALTVPTSKTTWWKALFSKKTRAKVRMPWSVASVRGTLGEVSADANCNETTLLTGNAHFETSGGDGTDVEQNQSSRVCSPEEPPDNPEPISSDKQKDLSSKKDWIQNTTNNQLNNASQNNRQAVETANQILQNTIQQLPQDTIKPSVSISSPAGSAVGTPTVTLTGAATDNVGVASLTVGGAGVGVDANGNFSASVTLQPGSNTIVAEATDGAGNSSTSSVTITFNAQLPTISVSGPATTKEKKVTVTGSATAPGGLKSVTLNGAGVTTQAGGSFSAELDLKPGLNVVEAVVTDNLNRTATATLEITSTTQPPLLSLSAGETKVAKPVYTLRGSAVAQYVELESVTVLGVPVLFSQSGSFTALIKLNPGENVIDVVATDKAGNSASSSVTVTLDATKPFIHMAQPRSGLVTKEATVEVHLVARAAAGIKSATVNGSSVAVGSDNQGRTSVSLNEGENTITAEIEDEVGQKASESRKVYRITKAPSVVVSSPEDGLKSAKRQLAVSGSAAASYGPLKSVSVNGGGVLLGSDGSFSATVTLQNGENTISVSATDLAGNTTTVTRTVNFNPLAATLTLTSPADGTITKDSSVTVSGSLQNGDEVQSVSVNGISVPVSGGSFSASIPLSPGKNTISVALPADAGGASESRTVIFADKAPTLSVSSPTDGLVTAKPEVSISGTALTSYGTPADVSVNGMVTGTDAGGGFSYTLKLKPGKTTISVSASDKAGNSSQVSRTVEFKPALPLITITSPAPGSLTKDASVTVSGRATSEVGIASVDVNGTSASVDADGNFSASVELKPGENSISITATDKLGGASTASLTVIRGGVPPTISIGSPSENFVSGQKTIVVSGSAKAAAGKITSVTVNGSGAGVGADGSWQAQVTLNPGENTLVAVATDSFGGTASVSRKVTLAEGNPTLELSSPADGTVSTRSQIAVSGKAKASTPTYSVRVNGSAVSTGSDGSFQTTVTLQGGTNTISVEVSDALNRTTSASRTVIYANEKPTVSISSPANGTTVTDPAITLSGSVTVMKGLKITSVTINGSSVSVDANGGFSAPFTLTALDTDTVFNVSVTDSAGNSASATHRVRWAPAKLTISLSAPASPVVTEKVTVSGSVSGFLGTASVTVNGQSASVSATGGFSAEVPLVKGSNTITASVTDGKGRTATSTPVTVTFAPTPPTLSASAGQVQNGTVTVSGSASSLYGPVTISANGQTFTGGTFSTTVQLAVGTSTITVTATDKYGVTTQTLTVVNNPPPPPPPVAVVEAATAQYSDPVVLKATVTQAGQPLANRTVTFRVGGQTVGTATTNTAGVAELTYNVDLEAGAHTVTVFDGTTSLDADGAVLTVQHETATIEDLGIGVVPGTETTLIAKVIQPETDRLGDLSKITHVVFSFLGTDDAVLESHEVALVGHTESSYYVAYQSLTMVPEGTLNLKISLKANSYFTAAPVYKAITPPPQIDFTVPTTTIYPNIEVNGTFEAAGGLGSLTVNGAPANVYFDDDGDSGRFLRDITLAPGANTILAVITDSFGQTATHEHTIYFLEAAVGDVTAVYGESITLQATVRLNGEVQAGRTVKFKVDGQIVNGTQPAVTDENGVATFTWQGRPVAGPHTWNVVDASSGVKLSAADAALTVTPKGATVRADDQTKIYGAADPNFTFTALDLVGNDALSDITCGVTGAHDNVSTYTISCSQTAGSNPNYTLAFETGTLTVTPKGATITASNKTKVYGDANPGFDAVAAGLVGNDTLNYTLQTTATQFSGVNEYPITITPGSNPNYTVTTYAGKLTVTPKALTVTANDTFKGFGDPNPPFTARYDGLVLNQTPTVLSGTLALTTTATDTSSVGTYPITPSGLSSTNYAITFADGTLTVFPYPQITVWPPYSATGSVTVSGKAAKNVTLAIKVDGETKTTATADGYGDFTASVSGLTDGAHSFTVTDTDHSLTKGSVTVVVDTVAPVVKVNGVADISSPTVTISGTFVEPNLKWIKVNDVTATTTSTSFSQAVTLGTLGINTISVMAEDLAGNITTTTVYVNYAEPPTLPRVRLVPVITPGTAGNELTVNVVVDNVPASLTSATVEITFNQHHLTLTGINKGDLLGGTGYQELTPQDLATSNTSGTIKYNIANPNGAAPNQTVLVTLTFTVKTVGSTPTTTLLSFQDLTGEAANGVLLLADPQNSGEYITLDQAPPLGAQVELRPQ